jgi:hypothetical protein
MRLCKPVYKIAILITRLSILLIFIGLILGLFGKGWMVLLIALGSFIFSIIISNMPNSYLVHFIKLYDSGISAKEATGIVQKHLQGPIKSTDETVDFVHAIMSGVEKEKRLSAVGVSSDRQS